MIPKILIAVAAAASLTAGAAAGEIKSPRDSSTGLATGKVSVQDLHFTSRADAVSHCSGAPISQTGSSFSCSAPISSDMAINEKGLPGTKMPKPASPK